MKNYKVWLSGLDINRTLRTSAETRDEAILYFIKHLNTDSTFPDEIFSNISKKHIKVKQLKERKTIQ